MDAVVVVRNQPVQFWRWDGEHARLKNVDRDAAIHENSLTNPTWPGLPFSLGSQAL